MFITSFSPTNIASNVWANITRTLTADPATDAGSATLNWTHAARSITVDPATDAGSATLNWTHATRSLTSVWGGAMTTLTAFQVSIATGTHVDLRAGANESRVFTVTVTVPAASTCTLDAYNGTTFVTGTQVTGGTTSVLFAVSANFIGMALSATGTSPSSYCLTGWKWD